MVAELITHVYATMPGFKFTFGDAYRSPVTTHGSPRSLHRDRLAIDLNLFVDGEWISCAGNAATVNRHVTLWEYIGEYWELIGGTWGGRFNDFNHFSLGHNGRK